MVQCKEVRASTIACIEVVTYDELSRSSYQRRVRKLNDMKIRSLEQRLSASVTTKGGGKAINGGIRKLK